MATYEHKQNCLSQSVITLLPRHLQFDTRGKIENANFQKEDVVIYLSWTHKLNVCLEA